MFFGKSFILSLVIEKLLSYGAAAAESALEGNQEKIEHFIRDIIPGELLDDVAVEFVRANLPLVLSKVKEAVGGHIVASNVNTVAGILKQVEPGLTVPATIV